MGFICCFWNVRNFSFYISTCTLPTDCRGKVLWGGGGGGVQMKGALAMNFTGLAVHNIDNYCYER